MSTPTILSSLDVHESAVASFLDDDANDIAEASDEIYTEGAVHLEEQFSPVLKTYTPTPLTRTDTAFSLILNCAGRLVHSFAEFCAKVRSSRSLGKAKIRCVECYRQSAGPMTHRFLLLHLWRPGRSDIWLRIDRQLAPNLTLPKFFARHLQSTANDSISMAGSPDVLVKGAERENRMRFIYKEYGQFVYDKRPTLSDLSEILGRVGDNLPEYKLWPENCWLMCSLLQDILERSHGGIYDDGALVFRDLAPRVRRRIMLGLTRNSSLTNRERLLRLSDLTSSVKRDASFDPKTKQLLIEFSRVQRKFQQHLPLAERQSPLELLSAASSISAHLSQMGYVSAAHEADNIVLHAAHLFDPLRPLTRPFIHSLFRAITVPVYPRRLNYANSDMTLILDSLHRSSGHKAALEHVKISEYLYRRDGSSHLDTLCFSLGILAIYTRDLGQSRINNVYRQAIELRRIGAVEKPDELARVLSDYGSFLYNGMEDTSGALKASLEAADLYRYIISTRSSSIDTYNLESCGDLLRKLDRSYEARRLDSAVLGVYRRWYAEDPVPKYTLCRSIHRNAFNLLVERQWRTARDLLAELLHFLPLQDDSYAYKTDLPTLLITVEMVGILCCLGEGVDCSGDVKRVLSVFRQETVRLEFLNMYSSTKADRHMHREAWGAVASGLREHGSEELATQIHKVVHRSR